MTPSASSGGKTEKTLQKDAGINTSPLVSLGKGAKFMHWVFGLFVLGISIMKFSCFLFNRFYFIEQFHSQKNSA